MPAPRQRPGVAATVLRSINLPAALVAFLLLPAPGLFAQEGPEQATGPAPSAAASEAPDAPTGRAEAQPPEATEDVMEDRSFIDALHAGISHSILASSEWLDSFFYDPRYAAEENRTRMIMRVDFFDEEDAHMDIRTRFQFKIRLPQLTNRAHIVISGDPDDETDDTQAAGTYGPLRLDQPQDRNVSTAVGYFFRSDKQRHVSARLGFRYRQGDLAAFIRPHYRILHALGAWSLRFTQEFPWWSDTKWESMTAVDLERLLRSDLFLRSSLIGRWFDDRHGYSYQVISSLTQPLSPRRAIGYEVSTRFETRPNHRLEEIGLVARYRQRIWRDWVYYELAPQMRFPRDRDFDLVPGFLFRLEMFFGKYD